MKCLVLAAGQGTRLRSMAPSKPLAPVKGVPLLEHVVRAAKAGGASEFVIVTGYEAEGIEAFLPGLAERVEAPIEAVRNGEWERPNGVSVLAAEGRLGREFVLLMSDHLFDPGILAALLAGRKAEAELTLAADYDIADPLLDLDDATKLDVGEDRRILRIGKAISGYNAIDTGIFLATPALFKALRASLADGGSGSLSEGVQRLSQAGGAFAFDIGARWWLDVDDAAAHARAEREFAV